MLLFVSPAFAARQSLEPLYTAARSHGIEVRKMLATWNKDRECAAIPHNSVGAVYGEQPFCEFIAQEMKWALYQNSIEWLSELPHTFLKRSIKYMTLADAKELEKASGSVLDRRFIAPADEVSFSTAIYVDRFPAVGDETPVFLSSNELWDVRCRYVILNGKIVTNCCYYAYNTFNEPIIWDAVCNLGNNTATNFMNTVLDHVRVAPSCVVDIGYLKEGGWAVIGSQPIWTANIFGCKPLPFLRALMSSCKQL